MGMDFLEKLNSFIDDAGKKIWTGAYKVGEKIVNYVVLNDSLPSGTNVLGKVGIDSANNGVTVNGSKRQLKVFRQQLSTTVATGAVVDVTVTPTPGYMGRILAAGFYAPAIQSATANHGCRVQVGASANYGAESLRQADATVATTALELTPSSSGGGAIANGQCMFSEEFPLVFKYFNSSGSSQTGARIYYCLYEEVPIIP
jgi:hypothetical protein